MAYQQRPGTKTARGDVQHLDRLSMIVYEAVATMDHDGRVAELPDIVGATGLPEDEVRAALEQLISEGHICRGTAGYFLDAPDWAP